MYARSIVQSGYSMLIENTKGTVENALGASLDEFTSHTPRMIMPSSPKSLNLEIKDLPDVPWGDPNSSDWGNVEDYLLPEHGSDLTAALQAAIDSGHKTVYIPAKVKGSPYVGLSGTVYVRNNCERIISLGSRFTDNAPGKIEVVDGTAGTVILERLRGAYTKIEYVMNTSRTVILSSMPTGFGHVPFVSNGTGDLHIVDVPGQFHFNNPDQKIWCRQINPEGDFPGLVNKGADLWILGTKTEGGQAKITTTDGGRTELLGGQVFANVPLSKVSGPNDPLVDNIFVVDNSSFSFAGIHRRLANTDRSPYDHWVKEIRGTETRSMKTDRKSDEPIALFVANPGTSSAPPAAPESLKSSVDKSTLTLTWVDNASDELAYEIQRSTNSSFSDNVEYFIADKNDTSFSIKGVDIPTTLYYYKIRAFNEGEYSGWSNTAISPTYTISSSTGTNGSIWPEGDSTVILGSSVNYTFNPDSGYQVEKVLVNNVAVDSIESYNFANIAANHTIGVTFSKTIISSTLAVDAQQIKIYPNPIHDNILQIDGLMAGALVSAYSVTGVKLFEKQAASHFFQISTTGLPKGCIIIAIKQENNIIYKKLINN
ncbi:MAG: hypothetical protein HC896_05370 [Bacteroidales bacterium]|nr:hypothetical protein [Bacteroidales bacterium]